MPHAPHCDDTTDRLLRQALVGLAFLGAIVLLSLPAARGAATPVGWMPLWLLGMPLASLLALHLRDLAGRPGRLRAAAPSPAAPRARPRPIQARRRGRPGPRVRLPAAA